MYKKEFLKVSKSKKPIKLTDTRTKKPTISDSVESSKNKWSEFQNNQFKLPGQLEPLPEIDNVDTEKPQIELEIDMLDVLIALKKCKMNTAAGPSKISYKHITSMQEANPNFITTLVERILNNLEYHKNFSKMTIIPIQKTAKRLPTDDPAAFRPVALSETIFKLSETVFINKVRHKIESEAGDFQNA